MVHSANPALVAIFGPHPLLGVAIESRGGSDDIHFHPGGQGVWVARMAGEMGAHPILCGFVGAEPGVPVGALLAGLPGERRLVPTTGPSGSYVADRRAGGGETLAIALADPPSRHELDALFSVTIAAALAADILVVCNPFPGDALPASIFGDLVTDVRANGTPVLVDLSTPRLDDALAGRPDLVKLNDWELAELVRGPVDPPHLLRAAAQRLRELGAANVLVTRAGEPALALLGDEAWELVPPRLEAGSREGCGDSMMGAIAAARAAGRPLEEALVIGAAAGAVNFLHHGLGTGTRREVEEMVGQVELRRA